jgi:hypothetical protein
MRYPELEGYICLGWSDDLKPWGIIVSGWYRPRDGDFAWLYKRDGQYHVAKTYEEQVAIHRRYGIPVVPPGAWFKSAGQPEQLTLF